MMSILNRKIIWTTLGVSLFWVLFLWGFWEKGTYALGWNATIFLLLVFALFTYAAREYEAAAWKNWFWILPLLLMMVSFSIFENPFLKTVTLGVFPLLFVFFFNEAILKKNQKGLWNFEFLGQMLLRCISFLSELKPASLNLLNFISDKEKTRMVIKKILAGILIFLILAFFLIVPLLSSASPAFADKMEFLLNWLKDNISFSKIATFIFLSLLLLAFLLAWTKKFEISTIEKQIKIDDITGGIVLGGVLLLYLLFLWTQAELLWAKNLPLEFQEVENLVKSGFWQLFFLSIINIIFYFFYYRKTDQFVQAILKIFTLASLLLLLSAGHRMFLYVWNYGLSYEKFFASYTVFFCFLLFSFLLICLFKKERVDIFKFLLIAFLWMYSILTVFPVEYVIFKTNAALSQEPTSRIDLYELKMLSGDALPLIKTYRSDQEWQSEWENWIVVQEMIIEDKTWYEKNILNFKKRSEALSNDSKKTTYE